jgi:hypothetical protein
MVESQRDLLLKAVHELRQKSAACQQTGTNWDATSDINRVLRELGVHANHSEVVRESIMEELATPRPSSEDTNSVESHHPQSQLGSRDASSKTSSSIENPVPGLEVTYALPNEEQSQLDTSQSIPNFDTMFDTNHQSFFDDDSQMIVNSQINSNFQLTNRSYQFHHVYHHDHNNPPQLHNENPQFDENVLMTERPPSSRPYFNFQDPTDLDYLRMDSLR